jgi:hypothetical protein
VDGFAIASIDVVPFADGLSDAGWTVSARQLDDLLRDRCTIKLKMMEPGTRRREH